MQLANLKVISFQEVDSTNQYLKKYYQSYPHFTFVRADYQTEGRGQFDRRWLSNKGENLLFSLLLKDIELSLLNRIKLWVQRSIIEVLKTNGLEAYFKEPNDIYVGQNKIAGILTETKITNKRFDYIIIGVGLNVNQVDFNSLSATSIRKETNQEINLISFFQRLIKELVYQSTDI